MSNKIISALWVVVLIFSMILAPTVSQAQQKPAQEEDSVFFYVGSGLFSLLLFPMKLTTCIGTQAVSAVAYTATYGVPGHYDEDTNGKDIGETARGACKGAWWIGADDVKRDYGQPN